MQGIRVQPHSHPQQGGCSPVICRQEDSSIAWPCGAGCGWYSCCTSCTIPSSQPGCFPATATIFCSCQEVGLSSSRQWQHRSFLTIARLLTWATSECLDADHKICLVLAEVCQVILTTIMTLLYRALWRIPCRPGSRPGTPPETSPRGSEAGPRARPPSPGAYPGAPVAPAPAARVPSRSPSAKAPPTPVPQPRKTLEDLVAEAKAKVAAARAAQTPAPVKVRLCLYMLSGNDHDLPCK